MFYTAVHGFACSLPAVCGAYIGVAMAAAYTRRVAALREFLRTLTEIKIYIRNSTPLYKIPAVTRITGDLLPDDDFFIMWEKAVRANAALTDSDKDVMLNFGISLGRTDIEGQYGIIDTAKDLTQKNLKEAEELSAKKGGTLRRAGILFGLLASLILL